MPGSLSQVLSRIHEIQALLGQKPQPNEVFGEEMTRSTRAQTDRERDRSGSVATGGDSPARGDRSSANLRQTPDELASLVDEASSRTGLPAELISSVIATESGNRPDAVSPAGALGLMQLMPGTARTLGVDDPLDPRENVMAGAEYLRRQLNRFGSVEKALAAYNAGPQAVSRFGGIPPYPETQSYVRRVLQSIRRLTSRRE
jgi:soluble lytic murein transglycosylase-like protein